MSTLTFDFPECVFWVGLTWFVCDKSDRSLGTKLVFLSSPECTVYFNGFVLFTLEPSLFSFTDVRAVLWIKAMIMSLTSIVQLQYAKEICTSQNAVVLNV